MSVSTALESDSAPASSLLARVEGLNLHFRTGRGTVRALRDATFDIHEAETLALVGETGCGKSVTGRSFLQLVPTPPGFYPGGHVYLRDAAACPDCGGDGCQACYRTGRSFVDLLSLSPSAIRELRGRRIAMIFQDPSSALNPSLTIRTHLTESILANRAETILRDVGIDRDAADSVLDVLLRRQVSADRTVLDTLVARFPPLQKHRRAIDRAVRERAIEVLDDTQIPNPAEVLDRYPHELSGGMRQRVMIATALVGEPDLLIADEPTTALDVTIQARILSLVQDLQEKYDTSVLYITHNLSLVRTVADRVAVMYAGTVAETGAVEDVFERPLHPYTRGLLDCVPSVEDDGRLLAEIEGTVPDMTDPPEGCRFAARCPYEMDHCAGTVPPDVEEAPGHAVACHLYPEEGEPPHPAGRGADLVESADTAAEGRGSR